MDNFGYFYQPHEVVYIDFNEAFKGSIIESDLIKPQVVEGAELLDTLCPVSKNTGRRENALSLLGKITGANSALLNSVLQEIPALCSDPRLSDADRVATVVDRLSTGSPAEDALMAERIMMDIDALGLSSKFVEEVKPSDAIKFESTDVSDNPE